VNGEPSQNFGFPKSAFRNPQSEILSPRGNKGFPMASHIFYGPDDKKASKAVLGIVASGEQWNEHAEKMIQKLEAEGVKVERILLDIEEIKQFCEEQGVPNDGGARSRLALRKFDQSAR
jgi:hypothetical protein